MASKSNGSNPVSAFASKMHPYQKTGRTAGTSKPKMDGLKRASNIVGPRNTGSC